jgi:hypothetical protein
MIRLLKGAAWARASPIQTEGGNDSARDAIFIKDRDRRYIVANRTIRALAFPGEILGATDRTFSRRGADHKKRWITVTPGETSRRKRTRPVTAAVLYLSHHQGPLTN